MSKLYNKNLGVFLSVSSANRRTGGRLTAENIMTLKSLTAQRPKENFLRKLGVLISGFVQSLLLPCKQKNHKMCENYGHTIDRSSLKGRRPICADCGCIVTEPSMLRKSSLARANALVVPTR